MRYIINCKVCGHEWRPYKPNPRACPKCKSYINYTEPVKPIPINEPEDISEPTEEEIKHSLEETKEKGFTFNE